MLCSSLLCLALLGAEPTLEPESVIRILQQEPRLLGQRGEIDAPVDDKAYSRFRRTQALLVKTHFVLNAALRNPEINQLPVVKAQGNNQIAWVRENLIVELPEDSDLVVLKFKEGSRDERAKLINAIAGAYIEEIVVKKRRDQLEQQEMLRGTYNEYMVKKAEVQKKIHRLTEELGRGELGVLSLNQEIFRDYYKHQYRRMADRLLDIEAKLAVLEHRAKRDEAAPKDAAANDKDAAEKESDKGLPPESSSLDVTRRAIADLQAEQGFYKERLEALRSELRKVDQFSTDLERAESELKTLNEITYEVNRQLMLADTNLKAPDRIAIIQEAQP